MYNFVKCDFKVLINVLLMWFKECLIVNSNEKKDKFFYKVKCVLKLFLI